MQTNTYRCRQVLTLMFLMLVLTSALPMQAQDTVRIDEVRIERENWIRGTVEERKSISYKTILTGFQLNGLGHYGAGEALFRQPRIRVQGPPMVYRNPKVAGLDKEYQTILIDGVRPAGGEDRRDYKLDRVPVDILDEISVDFNPDATQENSSPSGNIRIGLKEPSVGKDLSVRGVMSTGSMQFLPGSELGIGAGNSYQKWRWLAHSSYTVQPDRLVTQYQDSQNGIEGKLLENNRSTNLSGYGALEWRPDSTCRVLFKLWLHRQEDDETISGDVQLRTQGGLAFRRDTSSETNLRTLVFSNLLYEKSFGRIRTRQQLTFSESDLTKQRNRTRDKNDGVEVSLEEEAQKLYSGNFQFTVYAPFKRFPVEWKAGLISDINHRNIYRMAYSGSELGGIWEVWENGSYELQDYQVAGFVGLTYHGKRLSIMTALRGEGEFMRYSTEKEMGSNSMFTWLPSFHLKWTPISSLSIRTGISRRMTRPPYLYWVPVNKIKHKKQIIEMGNPNLTYSSGWNVDASVNWTPLPGLRFFLDVYDNRISHMFETQYLGLDDYYGYRIFMPVNLSQVSVFGFDAGMSTSLSQAGLPNGQFHVSYSYAGSRYFDQNLGLFRSINDQPHHLVNLTFSYFFNHYRLKIEMGWHLTGGRIIYESIGEDGTLTDRILYRPDNQLSVLIRWYPVERASMFVNLQNLTNSPEVLTQGTVTQTLNYGIWSRLGLTYRIE